MHDLEGSTGFGLPAAPPQHAKCFKTMFQLTEPSPSDFRVRAKSSQCKSPALKTGAVAGKSVL